jgi:hypothetical protein
MMGKSLEAQRIGRTRLRKGEREGDTDQKMEEIRETREIQTLSRSYMSAFYLQSLPRTRQDSLSSGGVATIPTPTPDTHA